MKHLHLKLVPKIGHIRQFDSYWMKIFKIIEADIFYEKLFDRESDQTDDESFLLTSPLHEQALACYRLTNNGTSERLSTFRRFSD